MPRANPFLIIGHPGHELAIHHWLETARPQVFVLTDGSGLEGQARIEGCRACLAKAGAEPGGVFGPFSDRAWYAALLSADAGPLLDCGLTICREALDASPELIVSDGLEGQEPLHDLAFFVAQAVVRELARQGRRARHWSFPVAGPIRGDEPMAELALDAAATERKRAAACSYPGMELEVRGRLAEPGFRLDRERLHAPETPPAHWRPAYERVGRRGVEQGRWAEAIGFASHVEPMVTRLQAMLSQAALPAPEPVS